MSGFDELLGLVSDPGTDGGARVAMTATDEHLNPAGFLHGGAIATLIDVAMGKAVASLLSADDHPVTIEMKVNYLEPGGVGGVVADARVSRQGKRLMVVHAEVTQSATGETLAEAMGTFTRT